MANCSNFAISKRVLSATLKKASSVKFSSSSISNLNHSANESASEFFDRFCAACSTSRLTFELSLFYSS